MQTVLLSSSSKEWYTPWPLLERIRTFYGEIDLDPCSDPRRRVPAAQHFIGLDGVDGLKERWWGRVFVNPPYGRGGTIGKWLQKALSEPLVKEAIFLLPSRTGTRWFQPCWDYPCCFLYGRQQFLSPEGAAESATFDSVLVYIGPRSYHFMAEFASLGRMATALPFLRSPERAAA